jgi:hypothetical protein
MHGYTIYALLLRSYVSYDLWQLMIRFLFLFLILFIKYINNNCSYFFYKSNPFGRASTADAIE